MIQNKSIAQSSVIEANNYTDEKVDDLVKGDIQKINQELDTKQPMITGGSSTVTSMNLTPNRGLVSDEEGKIIISDVSGDELNYVSGVTSKIQDQLDNKDVKGSAEQALVDAKFYTDTKIAGLINGAPTTLDTLGEIANAMAENSDVIVALETAIGTKAEASTLTSHTSNKNNPHGVTISQIGAASSSHTHGNITNVGAIGSTANLPVFTGTSGKLETKSAANALSALGLSATATELNFTDGVTSNIQTQLNGKAPSSHSHSYIPLSGATMSTGATISRAGLSTSWYLGRVQPIIKTTTYIGYGAIASMKTTTGSWDIGVYTNDMMYFTFISDENYNNKVNKPSCQITMNPAGRLTAPSVAGAVWNDYAEYRKCVDNVKPGMVICEVGDDTMSLPKKDKQPGAFVVSDTFGFSIGETAEAKTPVAVSGRVLVYTKESRDVYRKFIGRPVCATFGGKVRIMTKGEARKYNWCILGYISSVPDYEIWGTGNVKVDGRVWITVK